MIETFIDLRGYFHERLENALGRQRVDAEEDTRAYLVELLAALCRAPAPGEVPLATQLAEAVHAPAPERLRRYRTLGDEALCLAGFFGDHLGRRGISPEYVHTMGGSAYDRASTLARHAAREAARAGVYRELSRKFVSFTEVLDEVREHTALRTPQEIVKLYDKWRRTRSRTIAERLCAEGVVPDLAEPSTTLH